MKTLAAIVVLRNHAAVVDSAVWTHGIIVVISALLMCGKGQRRKRETERDPTGLEGDVTGWAATS